MYVDAQRENEFCREAKDLLILVIVMLDKRNYRCSIAGWDLCWESSESIRKLVVYRERNFSTGMNAEDVKKMLLVLPRSYLA
jgi:hypothetical protein